MTDFSHLNAILDRLHREEIRLAAAKSESEIALRAMWVQQTEKELAAEYKFLGLEQPAPMSLDEIMDDELLAELMA